jgi:hypothetical protein
VVQPFGPTLSNQDIVLSILKTAYDAFLPLASFPDDWLHEIFISALEKTASHVGTVGGSTLKLSATKFSKLVQSALTMLS